MQRICKNYLQEMKVTSQGRIKQKYSFEAPVVHANIDLRSSIREIAAPVFSLYSLLKGNPRDYFLVRVNGESMKDIGINDGDTLIVNSRALPQDYDIIIASLNGETLVKTFKVIDGDIYLIAENKQFLPIKIYPEEQFAILGVVKYVIHKID